MDKAILITAIATVLALGCVGAYAVLHEDKEVNYTMEGYCYTPGVGTLTITLDSHKDEITEGYWYLFKGQIFDPTPLTFVNGVATFSEVGVSYSVGPIKIDWDQYIEIPGFNCHRV